MIKTRYENVIWSIPTLFGEDVLCLSLLNILDSNKINYNFEIYGAPICAWSTNIYHYLQTENFDFIERTLDNFRFRKITPILSFDNYDISGIKLQDKFCNRILEKCNDLNCKVIISSSKLQNHIKKNYPNIYCIASNINTSLLLQNDIRKNNYSPEKELKCYNDLLKTYDRVIIRPEFVQTDLIKKINDMSRIEIIVNSNCIKNCEYLFNTKDNFCCTEKCKKDYIHTQELYPELFLTFEKIDELVNLGIKHFKLLPFIPNNNVFLLTNIINFCFKHNTYNSQLFNNIIENLDAIKIFYSDEIIKNAKIQNFSIVN